MEATCEKTILDIVRETLGRPELALDDDLFDHGGTSLSFVRVLARIYQDLNVKVPTAVLAGVATPRNIAQVVAARLAVPADR